MVKQRKAHKEQSFFGCVLPRWLVEIALGLQVAIVLLLLALSICFTVTFKRASPQLGSITEQVDYHFGAPSIAFLLGSILLCGLIVVLAVVVSKLPKRWALIALLAYVMLMQIIWLTSLNLVSYTYQDSRSLMAISCSREISGSLVKAIARGVPRRRNVSVEAFPAPIRILAIIRSKVDRCCGIS